MGRATRDFIATLDIQEGYSVRRNCLECNGKNTLSITKTEGDIIYHCYKCKAKGVAKGNLSAHDIQQRLHMVHRTELPLASPLEAMPVPEYVVEPKPEHDLLPPFIKRWGLEGVELLYDVKDKRAVFPIRHNSKMIDAVGRSLDGLLPKWYRYTGAAHVYLACQGPSNGKVVIVEDVISANTICSVWQNVTGLAILGTSLNAIHMEYIQDFTHIVLALDPDATDKNLAYRREIASWTGRHTIAIRLQDDIKYKLEADITTLEGLLK